ncbi:MAG: DUF1206 domain-containing protein [Lapillicoccus sp.]
MSQAPPRQRRVLLDRAARWGREVHRGAPFDVVVGVGLVTYGLVYLLVAAIAVRIAVTGQRGAATPYTALDELAATVWGEALLWVTAFGLGALTLWQVFETVWRRDQHENPIGRAFGRTGSTFSAIGYLALAVSAVRVAVEGRAAREGRRPPPSTVTAVEEWALRIGVVVVGVVLLVLAVRSVYRGARSQFVDDLKHGAPSLVVRLGQCGHIGKGVTYGIVGGLMLWTAVVDRIGPPGLQTVFRMLNLSPSGGVLLWLKAIGLALFGVYCLAWAANRRR